MSRTRKKRKNEAPINSAVIYARYSSNNQREESIDAQVRACREYAQAHGLNIVNVYADSAKTGTNDQREAFQQMLADSSKGIFSTLIIHKLDRFSRDRYDSAVNKRLLRKNRCRIVSVLEHLDDSPESAIMEGVIESFSEYYSKNLSREVKKGQKETALQCKHNGGKPPLGYDVDKDTRKCIINEKEAEIVRLIFSMYAKGCGYKEILRHLNAMGYRTKKGNQFANGSLNNILKNEKYRGIYIFNLRKEKDMDGVRRPSLNPANEVIRIEGGMPRIIDDVTFAKVQVLLSENLERGGSFKAKEIYILSGLIQCGDCGMSMHGNTRYCGRNKLKYVTYRCSGRSQKRDCKRRELNKTYIENFVLDVLYSNLFNQNSIVKLTEMLNKYRKESNKENTQALDTATQRLKEINREIDKTLEVVCQTGISIETVGEKLRNLEEQKGHLENLLHELTINNNLQISEQIVAQLVEKSKEFVKTKNLPECKTFIKSYVECVTVLEEKVRVVLKVNVPNKDNTGFEPLVVEESIKNIYENYKDAV